METAQATDVPKRCHCGKGHTDLLFFETGNMIDIYIGIYNVQI